jgi:hypothetical protein
VISPTRREEDTVGTGGLNSGVIYLRFIGFVSTDFFVAPRDVSGRRCRR